MFSAEQVTAMVSGNGAYASKETTTGQSLWGHWGLALLILIVIALFYGVNNRERKADERRLADNLYSLNGRMGIVEKGVVDNERSIIRTDQILTSLSQDYDFRIGKTEANVARNTADINELGTLVCKPSGCGCGGGRNIPEFVKKATFVQDGAPEVIQREACGNAYC